MNRAIVIAAIAALGVGAVSGCGGPSTPAATPTPAAPAAPAETAEPAPKTPPAPSGPALPDAFVNVLGRGGLAFETPAGFEPVTPVVNPHWNYQYALRSKTAKLELRFAVSPLDTLFQSARECAAKPDCTHVDPNQIYKASFMAGSMNIAGGELGDMRQFPEPVIREEFHAHWGAVAVLKPRPEPPFDGYAIAIVVMLHRDDLADVMIVGLADDVAVLDESWLSAPAFHALTFASPLSM
jgi:hypothetical protein